MPSFRFWTVAIVTAISAAFFLPSWRSKLNEMWSGIGTCGGTASQADPLKPNEACNCGPGTSPAHHLSRYDYPDKPTDAPDRAACESRDWLQKWHWYKQACENASHPVCPMKVDCFLGFDCHGYICCPNGCSNKDQDNDIRYACNP